MASEDRDYVQIATDYAKRIAAAKKSKKYGKWLRLAAQRFLNDLKHAQGGNAPFTFDPWHATDACDFIEKLPHVEGTWDSPDIVLHESHVLFVVSLFGFRKLDGTRRFTTALFAVARKNAKSTLCAAILLYCLCCEDEPGAQVISAATTGSQARIVFNVAKRMVEKTPDLVEAFTLGSFANSVARYDIAGSFKPINAKASTQDGLNPSHVGIDEIHAHKTHDLLNVLKSAAGARRNPLFLYTTTEGYTNPGPWAEIRHFAMQVLGGVVEADHFLALYFAVDAGDGDFDADVWAKANPLMDVNPLLRAEIQKLAIEAKGMPGALAEFRIKRLNRPAAAPNAWVDLEKWQACGGVVDLEWLRGKPCWMGLDMAATQDLCAMRLVWRIDGRYYTWGRRWVPEDAVAHRTERGTVPYAGWVEAGHIVQIPGAVIDYAVIERDINEFADRFKPKEIVYDPWNVTDMVNRLVEKGRPMVEFGQTTKNYHPAMKELERAYMAGELNHGADPVLQWCASNLVPIMDGNLNKKPDKKRSADKIDDMCALLMAVARASIAAEPPSKKIKQGFVSL